MYGKDNFIPFENRHHEITYNLRKINNFDMPKCRLTKTMSNFPVFALKICNKFPCYIFELERSPLKDSPLIGSYRRLSIIWINFLILLT
ncbi:hypothetical protein C0J52_24169 [Blattella germanica]|nr:hypothetical protein C0J52_24169 [Blattella germanica]